jgi:hypothetical protein
VAGWAGWLPELVDFGLTGCLSVLLFCWLSGLLVSLPCRLACFDSCLVLLAA